MIDDHSYLLGTWRGEGRGDYPTINAFTYTETITFTAIPGKPFFRYEQKTVSPEGTPMHTEVGFLRSPADGQLEFVLAQPTGQTELLHGHVEDGDGGAVLVFEDSDVVNSRSAKQVDATTRTYTVDLAGETLTTTFDMAAVGEPLQRHLTSVLQRVDGEQS